MTDKGYEYKVIRDKDREIICLKVTYKKEVPIYIPLMDILLQLEKYKGETEK